MWNDEDFNADVLANPLRIQYNHLNELQNRLGGEQIVADPNSGYALLSEMASSLTSQVVKFVDRGLVKIYPRRAITLDDLYAHLSDFDYINLTADPASTKIQFAMDAKYLRNKAAQFDAAYQKVIIPANTSFTIAGRTYGIYYPIEIRINTATGNFIVSYDTSEDNPLHTLADNTLDYSQSTIAGIDWLFITLPVWQFARTIRRSQVMASTGFREKYSYTDQFYACRVYSIDADGVETELEGTLSENIYAPSIPTAKIRIDSSNKNVEVLIPQIYIDNGSIGSFIRTEIYTTAGALDETFSTTDLQSPTWTYPQDTIDAETSRYSVILTALPVIQVLGVDPKVVGGSDGLGMDEFKRRIVTGSMYRTVPITPPQLEAYMEDKGFTLKKYIDNITNRIYYAYKTITGGNINTVLAATPSTKLDMSIVNQVSSIINHGNSTLTLLPSTVYQYSSAGDLSVPLTDTELLELKTLTGDTLVERVNTFDYTKSPYHIVVFMEDNYPISKTFDLSNPSVKNITFEAENTTMVAQANIRTIVMKHMDDGIGGFRIRLGVAKTTTMAAIAEDDISIYLSFKTTAGSSVYGKATFVTTYEGMYVYDLILSTNYQIDKNGVIRITSLVDENNNPVIADITLDSKVTTFFFVKTTAVTGVEQDYSIMTTAPSFVTDSYAANKQTFDLHLGEDRSEVVFNKTTVVWNPTAYATYDTTEYEVYQADEFKRDASGKFIYEIVNGQLLLEKLHAAGEIKYNDSNEPVVKHAAGDYMRDAQGNRIAITERTQTYYVETMQVDYRLFASQNKVDKTFTTNIGPSIGAYLDVLKGSTENLEQTKIYFKPNRTLGTGQFITGSGVQVVMDLGLSFGFKVGVTSGIMASPDILDSIRKNIRSVVEQHISKPTISITRIVEDIRGLVADYIVSIDIVGINNDIQLQTLVLVDEDNDPVVRVRMVKNDDGTVSLEKAIDIEFVPLTSE